MPLTRADRWNHLWVILMWADVWLSWLGRWEEDTGFARALRANTVQHRTHAVWKGRVRCVAGCLPARHHGGAVAPPTPVYWDLSGLRFKS